MIDFIIQFFQGNIYVLLLIICFLGQLGIPLGTMFFILYASSQANTYYELFPLFFIILFSKVSGDFTSYSIGKYFLEIHWIKKISERKKIRYALNKSRIFFQKRGGMSIFLTCFALPALGPYVNYIAGLECYRVKNFARLIFFGEMLYAAEVLLFGYFFKETFEEVIGFFTSFSILIVLGYVLLEIGRKIVRSRR